MTPLDPEKEIKSEAKRKEPPKKEVLSESGHITQYILDQGIGYFIISLYKWNNENSAILDIKQ